MTQRIDVYIEHKHYQINQKYSYLSDEFVRIGMRVNVNFNNQKCVAFVVDTHAYDSKEVFPYDLKWIEDRIDDEPILNQELLDLGLWMSETTCTPLISCFQVMVPKALRMAKTSIKPQMEKWLHLEMIPDNVTIKQAPIIEALHYQDLPAVQFKASSGILTGLIKKGIVRAYLQEKNYLVKDYQAHERPYALSPAQIEVLEQIKTSPQNVVCLFGKTGSGKTELYLTLAEEAMQDNLQSLIMVPEIALTQQMVDRVTERFGTDVVVYHSHLSDHERYLQYKRIQNNEAKLVVGTRSAIFLPFNRLSMIVLDEEHDSSYKQDNMPFYHTRDIAIKRAEHFNAKVILGSASPSFETFARAQKGVYALVELEDRVKGRLPHIQLVNNPVSFKQRLAKETKALIQEVIDQGKQVVILLNRRGYAPVLQCTECQKTVDCEACDRPLVYHKKDSSMKCHLCGHSEAMPRQCPHCGSANLRMMGLGTQRVEEELQEAFPNARILRMDRDATQVKNGHHKILDQFNKHEVDILLGTQMIAKGLDNPLVGASIILNVDVALMKTDYRSVEDAFSLMLQTAGRSGRGEGEAKVIIQTDLKQHMVYPSLLNHDYKRFYVQEMKYRKIAQNPPYTYLINVSLYGKEETKLYANALHITQALRDEQIKVLGPSDLGKRMHVYTQRILIKGKDLNFMRSHLMKVLNQEVMYHKWDCLIDVNPLKGLE